MTVIAHKAPTLFGKLTVMGLGIPIVLQAFINMGVALQLLPVTGQNLPMISSGGTSAWMTCIAMGIVLSVSAKNNAETNLNEDVYNEKNPLSVLSETV
jgi:cell division protein FtsW